MLLISMSFLGMLLRTLSQETIVSEISSALQNKHKEQSSTMIDAPDVLSRLKKH